MWEAPDPDQARLRDAFLTHLDRHPDGVARTGPPVHLTASCLVVDDDLEHVLLTLHRKARRWFQFGGHLEPGDESLHEAATREAREESGVPGLTPLPHVVQLDRHALDGAFGPCRSHLDVRYVAVADAAIDVAASAESVDVRWWPIGSLPGPAADDLGPLVRVAVDGLA